MAVPTHDRAYVLQCDQAPRLVESIPDLRCKMWSSSCCRDTVFRTVREYLPGDGCAVLFLHKWRTVIPSFLHQVLPRIPHSQTSAMESKVPVDIPQLLRLTIQIVFSPPLAHYRISAEPLESLHRA
ncbi:hypothetical protein HBI38_148770 [Parastagonospora nodorum]|nr:hypothetical protein HBI78_141060 [Parastagonospora nodorum]KAH5022943.1 hypothetical protein HBI75_156340 [Parastagonospora nodorum]KAH6314635.1 hypothetical protein HBI38_148770 [Parastagonospora nodorum]